MVIKKCKKWWQYIDLTEKTEKPNRTELIRFGSVTKSNRFGSVLQKLAKTEPNRPMLTPSALHSGGAFLIFWGGNIRSQI